MLIGLLMENTFSFEKLAGPLIYGRMNLLDHPHHIITHPVTESVRTAAIFGANGIGKSNIVKGFAFLQETVLSGKLPRNTKTTSWKQNNAPQKLCIGFTCKKTPFYYGIEFTKGRVNTEELSVMNVEDGDQSELIFKRTTDPKGCTQITFGAQLKNQKERNHLKHWVSSTVGDQDSVMKMLSNNKYISLIKSAFNWFKNNLIIVPTNGALPNSLVASNISQGEQNLQTLKDAIQMVEQKDVAIIMDDMGQGVHPIAVEEEIRRHSNKRRVLGQLIFTTHQTNLINEDILRRDEIFMVGEAQSGWCPGKKERRKVPSEVYSLGEYKSSILDKFQLNYYRIQRWGGVPIPNTLVNKYFNSPHKGY